jgi:hypothetical protein
MQGARPLKSLAFGASVLLLAGCAGSAPQTPLGVKAPPADSPLTACINPSPPRPKPIDTAIAQDFADGRVQTRFSLGVVTVASSVLKTGSRSYLAGGQAQTASLQPYDARLAWIAVLAPDELASCPAMLPIPPRRPTAQEASLPDYQILAIDAGTGADGIIYSARTNAVCGLPGYRPASVAPAVEFVSVPWTLVTRGPGPQSATISYQSRSCDQRDLDRFTGTGRPAVFAGVTNPALVGVNMERILTACGPAVPTRVLLRSSAFTTDLPQHLVHAPVGALDVPN